MIVIIWESAGMVGTVIILYKRNVRFIALSTESTIHITPELSHIHSCIRYSLIVHVVAIYEDPGWGAGFFNVFHRIFSASSGGHLNIIVTLVCYCHPIPVI